MRRALIPILVISAVLAACGGNTPATQGPGGQPTQGGGGGTPTDLPEATDEPAATQSGGAGGSGNKPAGWDQYGKVHVEISGPVSKTADYGFIPAGSIFGGAQGSSLNFTIEDSNEIVSILTDASGKVIVSYGGTDFSMPAAECTTSNWNIGQTSASGSFECTAAFVIMASGATVQGGTIKGSFDAHV